MYKNFDINAYIEDFRLTPVTTATTGSGENRLEGQTPMRSASFSFRHNLIRLFTLGIGIFALITSICCLSNIRFRNYPRQMIVLFAVTNLINVIVSIGKLFVFHHACQLRNYMIAFLVDLVFLFTYLAIYLGHYYLFIGVLSGMLVVMLSILSVFQYRLCSELYEYEVDKVKVLATIVPKLRLHEAKEASLA